MATIPSDPSLLERSSTGPHEFVMEKWISCAPFERLLNLEIVEALDGKAVLTMPFHIEYAQGAGLMHGGALISLADTAVVMAIKSILPPHTHFGTISMEAAYRRPVKKGRVTAHAVVTDREDRTFKGRATVVDEEGETVLEFASVFKVARNAEIRGIAFKDRNKNT